MTGPVLPATTLSIVQILRNVTGRIDKNDPSFTDPIMIDYLNNFIQREHPTELRLFENQTWWDFSISETSDDPYPVDLDALGYSTIGPLAYISFADPALNPNTFKMFWYENPSDFYYRWPWNNVFTPQMPTYVLYYNNELTFRGPPDQGYSVRISAYQINARFVGGAQTSAAPSIDQAPGAYLNRYIAYGAGLDILSDYGEMDKYAEVFQVYKRYRGQVLARTWNQLTQERTDPDF